LILNAQKIVNTTIASYIQMHIDEDIYNHLESNKTKSLLIRNAQMIDMKERNRNMIEKWNSIVKQEII